MRWDLVWRFLFICHLKCWSLPVAEVTSSQPSSIDYPAICVLRNTNELKTFDGRSEELLKVAGETFMSLCADPNQFHVTVTVSGSYANGSAYLYLSVKDGSRVVKASFPQNGNFKYNSYNTDNQDCASMAGVQTIVRNFGESLIIETGFASIIVNRELKVESYMVQTPRSQLCGLCGQVEGISKKCSAPPAPAPGGPAEADHGSHDDTHEIHWSYDDQSERGPSSWSKMFAESACDTSRPFSRQSPINIETVHVQVKRDVPIPRYSVTHPKSSGELTNSGHTAYFVPVNTSCLLSNVPYSWDNYMLHGLHFHFGPDSLSGSEHRVDGKAYPGELHFVHYNNRYESINEAVKHSDGLLVIGIFVEVSQNSDDPDIHHEVSNLLANLPNVSLIHNTVHVDVDFSKIIPNESDLSSYYTYDGSLTTPSCNEIVRWVVLTEPWMISSEQLRNLRLLHTGEEDSEPMAVHGNYRPPAPLNGRTVVRRKPITGISSHSPEILTAPVIGETAHVEPISIDWNENDIAGAGGNLGRPSAPQHHGHTFSYDMEDHSGPSHWSTQDDSWEACDASRPDSRQSPIDILTPSLKRTSLNHELTYNHLSGALAGKLKNNGHAPVFSFDSPDRILNGVPHSCDQYELLQFHMHFGPDDNSGSEHFLDGRPFPAEVHFVHKNKKYPTVGKALQHQDGLAVIGVFVEVSPDASNPVLEDLVNNFHSIQEVGHDVELMIDPNRLLPSAGNWTEYMTYRGSLTTPGCDEVVTWIILPDHITITAEKLAKARSLLIGGTGTEPMGKMGNFRPPQPMNSRVVEYVTVSTVNNSGHGPEEHHQGHGHSFDYNPESMTGPAHWAEQGADWSACDPRRPGSRQSPIDITLFPGNDPIILNVSLKYNKLNGQLNGTLKNNGHAPVFEFENPDRILTGVPYSSDEYLLLQCQIHFGPKNRGSEHSIDGTKAPGEMHFVHMNRKYFSPKEALQHEDGFVVIGVFISSFVDKLPNPALEEIVENIDLIEDGELSVELSLDPNQLLPASGVFNNYFTYPGSLTTPGCFEVVRWIILPEVMPVPSDAFTKFGRLLTNGIGSEPMGRMGNSRPLQPPNGRVTEIFHNAN